MEHECEDSACIRRVLGGEHHAYDKIVHRYETRIFSLLFVMTRDRPGAEEITQDTFLRAYSNLRTYDPRRPLYPWLATIASRLGINWINRTGARQKLDASDVEIAELAAQTPALPDELATQQVECNLWDHVASLPQGERTAVLMFYKQDLTVREIAGILGVTDGTIKTFLHRGRSHLRARLESSGDVK